MEDFEVIKNQIIAGTSVDRHGERYSKDFFMEMIEALPARMPLHQQHQMSKATTGYLENFRIVSNEGEWVVVADVFIEKGASTPDLNGFSFSVTRPMAGNVQSALFHIYLPYPYYNDQAVVSALLIDEPDLMVGKWIKKGLSDLEIGLIATGICLLVAPEWDLQYKEHVRPAIKKLLSYIPKLEEENISVDLLQQIDFKGQTVQLYFVPERSSFDTKEESLHIDKFETGYRNAINVLSDEAKCSAVGVRRVKLIYNVVAKEYKVFHIEFADGTDLNIA